MSDKINNLNNEIERVFESILNSATSNEKQPTTEIEKDSKVLLNKLIHLDGSFENLLNKFLLIPLQESTEEEKEDINKSYEDFFNDFKTTAKLMVDFFNKYQTGGAYADTGLIARLEKKYLDSQECYNTVVIKANKNTDPEYQKLIDHLNDAYFAYVYLLRGYNSIINVYNTKHPEAQIRQISNVPAPETLGTFADPEVQTFVTNFITSLKQLL